MRLLKKLLLVLTPLGAAAFVAGGGTFSSFAELIAWRRPARAKTATTRTDGAGLYRAKKVLLLMMLVGVVAYFAGNGTFASFSAEVSNTGSSIASGTLTLTSQVNSTTCYSYNGVGNVESCNGGVLTLGNLGPGVFGGTDSSGNLVSGSVKETLTNGGSIDASKFYVFAPQVTGTVNNTVTDNATGTATVSGTPAPQTTSLTISPGLPNALLLGTKISLSDGTNTESVTLTADAAAGATTLSVTPTTKTYTGTVTATYPKSFSIPVSPLAGQINAGQKVVLTSGSNTDVFQTDTTALQGASSVHVVAPVSWPPNYTSYGNGSTLAAVDCYDSRTSTPGITGATSGTDVKGFDTTAGNPLCSSLLMSIQEVDSSSQTYCWSGSGSSPETAIGMCNAPISTTLSTGLTSGNSVSSLTLSSLNGNIRGGDTLTITSGSHSQSFTVPADDTVASGGTTANASTLPLSSAVGTALASGTAITIGSGATQDTVTTTAPVASTATSIPVTAMAHAHSASEAVTYAGGGHDYFYTGSSVTVPVTAQNANFSYPTGTSSTVVDTTELNNLNSDQTDTLTNFDTLHPSTGEIPLYPVTGNGTDDTASPIWLGHSGSSNSTRTFYISVYMPKPSGTNQNALQGLSSLFGLTWHIDQL